VSTDETQEIGTTTGLDQVVGTTTVDGTYTNDDGGIDTIFELGIEAITLVGTDEGTLLYSTIANPEEIV
jgi:hypothetical protein